MDTRTDFRGETGRIYIARKGAIMVAVLADGSSFFINCQSPSNVWAAGPVPQYWQHSIDWAGGFVDHFTFGLAYDETERACYPAADPIIPITAEHIAKLRIRAGLEG